MNESLKKHQVKKNATAQPFSSGFVLLILVVSVIGLGVAAELTHIHYESHTNPNFKSICAINESLNCETVARSPYSVALGLPVSVWGIFAYSFFIVVCAYLLSQKRALPALFVTAAAGALVTSALLAYISTFLIQSLCLFCSTLYVVNTVLFAVGVAWIRRQRRPLAEQFADEGRFVFSRLRFFLPLAANAAVLLVATMVFYPRYWSQSRFDTLPRLATGQTEDGNHWIGAENPRLTLVEFSDYECPYCRRAHYQMRMMLSRYAGEVRLVHKHMPMDNKCNEYLEQPFHERACEFARVVECAGKQGKFWEMNDALFGIQENIPTKEVNLKKIAVELGLDWQQVAECMKSAEIAQKIGAQIDEATRLKIPGTPTYFVGSQPYPGGIPEQTLKKYLKKE